MWVTSNSGASRQSIDAGLPAGWVTRVVVDPSDASIAYVTFSGLRWSEPLPHVFRTTNRGATWTDITGDLPDAPVNDLAIDPRNGAYLYVATDVGVFATSSTGFSWAPLGSGMPEAVVNDLKILSVGTHAHAATYGRSSWKVNLAGKVAGAPEPRGRAPARRLPSRSVAGLDHGRVHVACGRSGPARGPRRTRAPHRHACERPARVGSTRDRMGRPRRVGPSRSRGRVLPPARGRRPPDRLAHHPHPLIPIRRAR